MGQPCAPRATWAASCGSRRRASPAASARCSRRLLQGRTIGQIAKELDIAKSTTKQHAIAVYAAFDVSSRADLIFAAGRRGVA
jgi:DNA-binding CsgD family transcriptional regulator